MLLKELFVLFVLTTLGCEATKCQEGYTSKDGLCYKFINRKMSYNNAEEECAKDGAVIAMPKSVEEQANVVAVRNAVNSKSDIWIGLSDTKNEGTFVWGDGEALVYSNWKKGEPSNTLGLEDCVNLGQWIDDQWQPINCANFISNGVVCQAAPLGGVGRDLSKTRLSVPTASTMLKRVDGNVDFDRNWVDYEQPFGNCKSGDCWIGLIKLHNLCSKNCKLEISMTYKGKEYTANYNKFKIGPASDKYRLTLGEFSGNAPEDLTLNNNMQFTTKDQDNDVWEDNCAASFTGGWWYAKCHWAHPTGTWGSKELGKGIVWKNLTTFFDSLTTIIMNVTPAA